MMRVGGLVVMIVGHPRNLSLQLCVIRCAADQYTCVWILVLLQLRQFPRDLKRSMGRTTSGRDERRSDVERR